MSNIENESPGPAWFGADEGLIARLGEDERHVSVRQVVALNLRRARRGRGLTQTELGEQLSELTGTPWSRATVSAAESGGEGTNGRVRHFDVDELVAFSVALRLPVAWFLLPPAQPRGEDQVRVTVDKRASGSRWALDPSLVIDLALLHDDPDDPDQLMRRRIEQEQPTALWDQGSGGMALRSLRADLESALAKLDHLDSDSARPPADSVSDRPPIAAGQRSHAHKMLTPRRQDT